ncbi:MAG: hypothetical protein M1830_003122 [Pleopsidium flavum]|nr:MAG: hypothetical protein M1830_003122 [Pleopsidium flavum]
MPPTRAVDWWAEHHAADLVGNSARLPSYFNNLPQNLFTKASIHHAHIIALAYGWLSVTRANRVRVSISENFSNVVEPNTQENHIEQSSVDARNPTTVDEGHRDELEQKGKAEESNESSLVTVLDSSPEKGGSKAIEITSIRVNLAGLYLEAVTEGTKKSVGWTDKTDDGQNLSCTSTNRESIQCPSDGSGYPLGGERPKVNDDSRDSSHVHEQVQRVNILRSLGLVPIEDPLPPKKKKKNKKRKAPERESSNIDTDQGKDMAGVGNGKLRAGDPTSGGSRFDRWISATSALNAVHDQIMATANFRLTPMASAFTTFDVTTAKSTRTRQSDFSTTAGEGAGGSSFNGRSSADNIQVIKRKSIGSSSKAGKRTSGVSQGGSTSDGVQKGDIGNSGVRGGKDKENETNSAVDSHKAIRKGAMEKEGLVALKVDSIYGVM